MASFMDGPLFLFLPLPFPLHHLVQWSSGLACWTANSEVWGSNPGQGRNLVRDFWLHLRPLAHLAMISTLTAHCRWEDETVRERTGHPPSYSKVIVWPRYAYCSFSIRSDSGTSRGRVFSNTREPQSDVIEADARIIHNWRFMKPIA